MLAPNYPPKAAEKMMSTMEQILLHSSIPANSIDRPRHCCFDSSHAAGGPTKVFEASTNVMRSFRRRAAHLIGARSSPRVLN